MRSRLASLDPVVVAAVAVGSLLRALWVSVAARQPVGLRDQAFYLDAAERLVRGDGYTRYGATSAYYPPGYPVTLAGAMRVVRVAGDVSGPMVAGLVNVVAAAVAIGATAVVARRLAGPVAARWTAWLCALAPGPVIASASALTEPLYVALVALGLVALVAPDGSLRTSGRPVGDALPPLVAAGVAWGAAVLVRPVLVFGLPVLLVASGWRRPWRAWLPAVAVVLVSFVVVVPWVVRNAVVMDRVTLSTNTGDNLCIGHNPEADGAFQLVEACAPSTPSGDVSPEALRRAEIARDDELTDRAVTWALDHPLDELSLVPRRLWHTFASGDEALDGVEFYGADRWLDDTARTVLRVASQVVHVVVLVAGTAGIVLELRRRRGERSGWWAVIAAMTGPVVAVVVFFGDPRFGAPVMWLLLPGVAALAASASTARRRAEDGP